ncbi:unnamed protein product [Aphanomyces euteiches]
MRAGDVVTSYDGDIVYDMPADPTYVLIIDLGNREDRTKKVFKNCKYPTRFESDK